MNKSLASLRTTANKLEKRFEALVSSRYPGATTTDFYKGEDPHMNATTAQRAIGRDRVLLNAHKAWMTALHRFYKARDGEHGFLGSRMSHTNPGPQARVSGTYAMFHGKQPTKATQIAFNDPKELIVLGECLAVEYRCSKVNGAPAHVAGKQATYRHTMPKGNILCTDETRKQLYILGPNLRVESRGIVN